MFLLPGFDDSHETKRATTRHGAELSTKMITALIEGLTRSLLWAKRLDEGHRRLQQRQRNTFGPVNPELFSQLGFTAAAAAL